jgi:hypothetical protein
VADINWKKVLSEALKKLGIIGEDFTGKIIIDCNQGGIRSLNRSEEVK